MINVKIRESKEEEITTQCTPVYHFCLSFFCLLYFLICSSLSSIISTNVQNYAWIQLYCGRWRNIQFPFLFFPIASSFFKAAINCHKQDNGLALFVFFKFRTYIALYYIVGESYTRRLCIWGDINFALWCRKSLLMNGISIYHECCKETCQQVKTTKKAAKRKTTGKSMFTLVIYDSSIKYFFLGTL